MKFFYFLRLHLKIASQGGVGLEEKSKITNYLKKAAIPFQLRERLSDPKNNCTD